MRLNKTFKLIIALIVSQMAGVIGSFFTAPAISTWYAELIKPKFNPPNWVFGPAWFILYLLMGLAAFLIWSAYNKNLAEERKSITILYGDNQKKYNN